MTAGSVVVPAGIPLTMPGEKTSPPDEHHKYQGKRGCSRNALIAGCAYQVVSTGIGALFCAIDLPQVAIPLWAAQGTCLAGYACGNYDRHRQMKKELQRLGKYISDLTNQQVRLETNAKDLKGILQSANKVVVEEGFQQVVQLQKGLQEISAKEANTVEQITAFLDEVVAGQATILRTLGEASLNMAGVATDENNLIATAKELEDKVVALRKEREQQGASLIGTVRRIGQLKELQKNGNELMALVSLFLEDVQATNKTLFKQKESLEKKVKELETLKSKAEGRKKSYKKERDALQQEMGGLQKTLEEAQRLTQENQQIVALVKSLAEKYGGMDALVARINQAVEQQEGMAR